MSNTEAMPVEFCVEHEPCPRDGAGRPIVEVITSREVPLGGPRAMTVRRTLPQRQRSLIGAWCFVDHYGPNDVAATGGMDVPPHPHTGLQTVSWLFTGEIEHSDSHGVQAIVRPGELNLMTGVHGICHSEVSSTGPTILHGVQLWVALPDASRDAPHDFQHYAPPRIDLGGASARVFLGALAGHTSPVRTSSALLGAEIIIAPGAGVDLAVAPDFEHGLLVDTAAIEFADTGLTRGDLGYVGAGMSTLRLSNPTDGPAAGLLLGGAPFGEEIVMWWNFVARTHEEIVAFREAWQNESERFGRVEGYHGKEGKLFRLPAPPLPTVRILPRRDPAPRWERGRRETR